jgi:hypothetical protein
MSKQICISMNNWPGTGFKVGFGKGMASEGAEKVKNPCIAVEERPFRAA